MPALFSLLNPLTPALRKRAPGCLSVLLAFGVLSLPGPAGARGPADIVSGATYQVEVEEARKAGLRVVRIGVAESAESDFFTSTVEPTLKAIEATLPNTYAELVRLSPVTIVSDIEQVRPDIFIAPAGSYLAVAEAVGAHSIATRKTVLARSPSESVGGAVIVRSDRREFQKLSDLRGRRAAATLPMALDGWLAARMALEEEGLDSRDFFSDVAFLGFAFPEVVSAVLSGGADAGVIPACFLERLEEEGLVGPGLLRVVGAREEGKIACRASTPLYPDLVAGALPWTDPDLARDVTIALLTPKSEKFLYGWQVTGDFHSVTRLYEALHLGPWAYLDGWTPSDLWRRFRWFILGGLGLLFLLGVNEWRLKRLVDHRTRQLREALLERDRFEEAERKARLRLGELERMGAISQLCAMIAHELKQPVGSVINYMTILRVKLGLLAGNEDADPVLVRAIDGAEREAGRIAGIVDRVRGYAKRQKRKVVPVDLGPLLLAASKGVRQGREAIRLLPEPLPGATVEGEPLELELLFLNLMKNAAEAAQKSPDPEVRVTLTVSDAEAVVAIEDNGPKITEAAFARLMTVSESVKEEGLGLGLAIVRNIVDEHGARLEIAQKETRGLRITVTMSLMKDDQGEES